MTAALPQRSGHAFPCPIAQGRHPAGKKPLFTDGTQTAGSSGCPAVCLLFFGGWVELWSLLPDGECIKRAISVCFFRNAVYII